MKLSDLGKSAQADAIREFAKPYGGSIEPKITVGTNALFVDFYGKGIATTIPEDIKSS